jgi:hypothetical protein
MADEEVDWGVEEVGVGQSETNGGTANATSADEDVLSLGGVEGASNPYHMVRYTTGLISSASPPVEKKPPTGPRSSVANPKPNSSPNEASLPYITASTILTT